MELDNLEIRIQSDADAAIRALDTLDKKLNLLEKGLGKMGNSSTSGFSKLSGSVTKLNKNLSFTSANIKGLGSKDLIGTFSKAYFGVKMLIRGFEGLSDSVKSAMDAIETQNYFNVALAKIGKDTAEMLGESGKEGAERYVEEFGGRLNELNKKMTGYIVGEDGVLQLAGDMGLGLNIEQMMNFQAKVLSVTNSVGLMGEASVSTAKAVSMLAGDISSLTNVDVESVMESLTSGLIGQSRALYKYGIDITNNTLQQYAYAEGIEKAVSEMTQGEKMQLRLLAILDQSEVAWGDLANTVDSVANQYRLFQQQTANLGRTFGNLFLPIVQNVLPYVNGLVIALNNLFTSLGFSMYGDTWLEDLQDGIGGSVQGDIEELEEGFEGASDSAKKLKQSLSSFDELNVLSISGVSSAADAENVIDLTQSISNSLLEYKSKWNEAFEGVENRANEFAEIISNAFYNIDEGHITAVGAALSGVATGLSTLLAIKGVTSVGNTISAAFGFLAKHPYMAIAAGIASVVGAITSYYTTYEKIDTTKLEEVTNAMDSSIENLNGTFSDFSGSIKELENQKTSVEDAINRYYELLGNENINFENKKNQLQAYVEYITGEFPELEKLVDSHTGLFTANKEEILANVDAITEYAKKIAMQDLLVDAYKTLNEAKVAYSEFAEEYNNFLKEFEKEYTMVGPRGEILFNSFLPGAEEARKKLEEYQERNKQYLEEISEHESKISQFETGNFEFLNTEIQNTVDEIADLDYSLVSASNTVEEKIDILGYSIETLNIETDSLVGNFGRLGRTLDDIFKTDAVERLQSEIDKLSKTEIEIPISFTGGGNFEKSLVNFTGIPMYYTGGFPEDGLFMANHNELVGKFSNGKTAVANNQQIVAGIEEAAYRGMMRAMQGNSKQTNVNVVLEGDANNLFHVVQDRANEYFERSGQAAFKF